MSFSDLNITQKLCEKFSKFDSKVNKYIEKNIDRVEVLSIFHYAAVRCIEQNRGNVELAKFIVKSMKDVVIQPGTIVLNFNSDLEQGIYRNEMDNPDSLLVELLLFAGQKKEYKWKDTTPFLKDLQDEFDIGRLEISGKMNYNFNTHIILGSSNDQEINHGDMVVTMN